MKSSVVFTLAVLSLLGASSRSLFHHDHTHCYTYERCHTEYMVDDKEDYREECQTFHDEKCETYYVKECHGHGYHKKCHSVPDERCLQAPRVECPVPIPMPHEVCETYPECESHKHGGHGLFHGLFGRHFGFGGYNEDYYHV